MFASVLRVETVVDLATKNGFYYKTAGVWHKTNPMPRNMNIHFIQSTETWVYFINRAKTGVFRNHGIAIHDYIELPIAPPHERKFIKHPTQKPVSLMRHFVRILSEPNNIILDPFMGSGSTGVAVLDEGENRTFIGIESSLEYYTAAENRLINHKNNE